MKQSLYPIAGAVLTMALLLAACAPTGMPTPVPTPTSAAASTTAIAPAPTPVKKLKVGLVLSGVINDLSWNQAMYDGATKLADAGLIDLQYTENAVAPADAERLFRLYADQGFDLVIGHSATYKDAIFKVAKEYPNVNFIYSAGGDKQTLDNLAVFNQPHHEPAYLVGMIAGGMTKTNKLAFAGGLETPGAKALYNAFKLGVAETNPNATVEKVYTGDFADIAKAKAAALTLADQGVDYFIPNGDGPARGTIEAARDRGLHATGFMMDMSPLAPQAVLCSMAWDAETALKVVVGDIQEGTFRPGRYYNAGVSDGVYLVKINPSLQGKIPADLLKKAEDRRQQIVNGAFQVPFDTN